LAPEGRSIRNIVFMGMGEPFHNEEALFEALDLLAAPEFFHHSPTKTLVSTVGVIPGMLRCADRFPRVNLALSLHSVRQSTRERIIPLAKLHPLDQLREAVAEVNRRTGSAVMIEYLLLAGLNDSQEEADELVAWLNGLQVHLNLIPYNPIDDSPHLVGSDKATREAFAARVKAAGVATTLRYSLGQDIAAACGQLVRHENRRRAMSD
jgi:23S rRNA (adenine2503-C2)-methyltransferase